MTDTSRAAPRPAQLWQAVRRRVTGVRRGGAAIFPIESALDPWERAVLDECRPYTLVSAERLVATMDAVAYAVGAEIPGSLVECGVWRGGNVLAMLRTLQHLGVSDRDLYLFDTFEGMTKPGSIDTSRFNLPALRSWQRAEAAGRKAWEHWFNTEVFDLDLVRNLLTATGYPVERVHFVAGMVEDTVPAEAPPEIAVLRLDTDWYESTLHEMEHLYPRLAPGGVLLIDDYGHWDGARKAVDEYFDQHGAEQGGRPLLARTDYAGRLALRPGHPG